MLELNKAQYERYVREARERGIIVTPSTWDETKPGGGIIIKHPKVSMQRKLESDHLNSGQQPSSS